MPTFQILTDELQNNVILEMMRELYAGDAISSADAEHHTVDATTFSNTIRILLNSPQQGRIVLFREDESLESPVLGYAILIPYWSNEFGGRIVFVDELFVQPFARSRGIAKAFFEELREKPPFGAVALALEISPSNARARRLYESVGFRPRSYSTLVCDL